MSSRWFDELSDDDFFTRPSRFRLLQADPWESLERLDYDFGRSDLFSDFATKAASLRQRVEQDRTSRQSPLKKPARRDSRVSDGIASPTPSSIHSAFTFGGITPPTATQPQGHVTFPASSCSNISECSQKSNDSITTEKSANHCSESEQLPGGGEACKVESTQSWVDRNTSGGVVGEGVLTETMKTESRPGSFQESSKQECSYVGAGPASSSMFHSTLSEEFMSQSSSSKNRIKNAASTTASSASGGKPFRAPPNRSLFYDELDLSLGNGPNRGARRRASALEKLMGLVDQVAHHDRVFQSEMDNFLKDRPRVVSECMNNRNDAQPSSTNKTNEDLKKENEALKEENSRLEQVLQEVTAVNKRWQRYNTDRRMYVQKLLATIQDLQEQMNDRAESAISRPSCGGGGTSEVEELKQHNQLLMLQIKSHREDYQAERQERSKILHERNELVEEVARLKNNLDILQNANLLQCCHCQLSPSQQTHVSSQDFSPRSSYERSFQVPFDPSDANAARPTKIPADNSTLAGEPKLEGSECLDRKSCSSESQSLYFGYPCDGLASVIGFSSAPNTDSKLRMNISSEKSDPPVEQRREAFLICPNCSRMFSQSRRVCFLEHSEFCQSTDRRDTS